MNPLAYYELKATQALFGKPSSALSPDEARKASAVARRYAQIEAAVLASDEARGVCLSPGGAEASLAEIRARYEDAEAFAADLALAGLDEAALAQAVRRDLLVDTVMARVGAQAGTLGAVEAEIFYYAHLERFRTPELRGARHILITVNESIADNRREAARRRIDEIAGRLAAKPARFEEQALKHSECPTALSGGLLGDVPRGKLYPELDAELFSLAPGQVGKVVETQLGFHLVRCERVTPEHIVPYAEVAKSLRERLSAERAQRHARQWLQSLLARDTAIA